MLDHLDDLDADFRVLYGYEGIGDERFPDGMTSGRFFALAERTAAYEGVMAARVAAEQDPGEMQSRPPSTGGRKEVVGTREAVMANAALAGVIDFA